MASKTVYFAGKGYTGLELTDNEQALLQHHLFDFMSYGNSFLQDLFRTNLGSILAAAAVAKEKFQAEFAGLLASDNQIGVQLIRPGHIKRTADTTETCTNTWVTTFTAGDDYWIGYSTLNTTAINLDKEALVLPMGVMFTGGASPLVEEILVAVGETTYPSIVIRTAWAADNINRIQAARFHPILVEPKQTVLARVYTIGAGVNELVLLGLTFGYGRYLRKQTYSSVST